MWNLAAVPSRADSLSVAVPAAAAGAVRPRVAFVFSGGGALGAIHAGQVRALAAAGIVPDLLVGVSVGALNASFLARGFDADRVSSLVELWSDRALVASVFRARRHQHVSRLLRGMSHVEDPSGLSELIAATCVSGDLRDAAVPLAVTTTDLSNGVLRVWRSGPAAEVVRASASLPGVFPPVLLDGALHVDGGVLNALPVQVALDAGAHVVFCLDIAAGTAWAPPARTSALGVLTSSFALSRRHLTGRVPTVGVDQRVVSLPAPDTAGIRVNDGSQSQRLLGSAFIMASEFLRAEGLDGASVAALAESLAPKPALLVAPASLPDPGRGRGGRLSRRRARTVR